MCRKVHSAKQQTIIVACIKVLTVEIIISVLIYNLIFEILLNLKIVRVKNCLLYFYYDKR